ncbi:antibiotic biosynthesis monooxygenase [Aquimarina algicola]|uniref:Antibiotic biosynthesis monooxygenase n=1 Tax=Aquimarina algicola TaxID=2589995 RepID=A0A504JMN2_9FLAO|nr:antibiotic biosynthesis monooxygenase [Aquimarina algicola]TPN88943.1 antibiotic biosynthesis monooxygenase [Aquimarina algicola]
MSYKVILTSKINAETYDNLLLFLEKNLPNVRSFKGCNSVDILFNTEKDEMVFYEDWNTKLDHLEYLNFIRENGVLQELSGFIAQGPEIKYFEVLSI